MSDLLKVGVGGSSYLCKWKPPFKQGWTEDENVTTSLGHKIPVDDCGIEMGLSSVMALPVMPTLEDNCGIVMSLVGQEELPYMHTIEEDCGIVMSLISIEEITQ